MGSWHVLDEGEGFKVKRIVVSPGPAVPIRPTSTAPSTGSWWPGRRPARSMEETVVARARARAVDIAIRQPHRIANQEGRDPGDHRGAARRLHGRGRHRAPRGRLRAGRPDRQLEVWGREASLRSRHPGVGRWVGPPRRPSHPGAGRSLRELGAGGPDPSTVRRGGPTHRPTRSTLAPSSPGWGWASALVSAARRLARRRSPTVAEVRRRAAPEPRSPWAWCWD